MQLKQIADSFRFNCDKHPEQPLNLFCDDDDCNNKGLICSLCEENSHNHTTSALKLILKDIHSDIVSFENKKQLLPLAAQIDNEFHKCLQILNNIKNREDARLLQISISQYFNKLKNMLLKPKGSEVLELIVDGKNKSSKVSEFNKFLLTYQNLYKNNTKPEQSEDSNYLFHLKDIISQFSKKYSQLQKGITTDVKLETLLQIYVSASYAPRINYVFSPTLKHTSHVITNGITVTQTNNYNTNIIMIEPNLQQPKKYSMKTKTINIKINRLTSWISVGVCFGNIVKNNKYYFNTGSTGHGAYVISNDGYTWHHSNYSLNSFYNGWNFQNQDIITVIVHPRSNTIKFHKKKSPQNSYEFQYEPLSNDKLYFCVSLSSHDQSVEIVND